MKLMDYKGSLDKEECKTARLLYICNITKQFDQIKWLLPTPAQSNSYDEALAHVVRVLSGNNNNNYYYNAPSSFGGNSCLKSCGEGCSKEKSRKYFLNKILNLLLCMQRNRLYDPPSDQEIGYYLLIKKYIKSIIIFYEARYGADRDAELGCFSPFTYLHHMTELVELNKYFEDLLPIVLNTDIKYGSKIKPLMDIKHENESPTIIHGSKERSNVFYWHKFQLALSELRSSKCPLILPSPEEKASYLQTLCLMSPPSFPPKECELNLNVHTKELHHLFIERIEREVINVERHCRKVKGLILEKLSLDKEWLTLLQHYEADRSEELDDVSRKMAENCDVSREELPSFIAYLDQCLQIVDNLNLLIFGLHRDNDDLLRFVHRFESDDYNEDDKRKLGWEAFHVLTVLKQVVACENRPRIGIGQTRSEVRSISQINQNSHKRSNQSRSDQSLSKRVLVGQIRSESADSQNHDCNWTRKCIAVGKEKEKEKNENEETLECIVEDLKIIGDSDVRPDEEELKLMHKIWNNVASSVHFFFCAMVYEQKRYVIKRGGLSDAGMLGVRTLKVLDGGDVKKIFYKIENLEELSISTEILAAYKCGLVGNLGNYKSNLPIMNLDA